MYHYIKDFINPLFLNLKGLDAELFDEQLNFFEKNFNVIKMEDLIEYFNDEGKEPLPQNSMLLTFDDGYLCHYTAAYPILKKHNMQGSFFIPARILDNKRELLNTNKIHLVLVNNPIEKVYNELCFMLKKDGLQPDMLYKKYATMNRYDDEKTAFCKAILQNINPLEYRNELINTLYDKFIGIEQGVLAEELYLNKTQILEMKANGMYIGPHGYAHSRLGNMTKEEIQNDIDKVIEVESDILDFSCWVMNYPYGHSSPDVVDYISKKGACCAITTEPRVANLPEDNKYLLPRLDCNDFPPKSENYKEIRCKK